MRALGAVSSVIAPSSRLRRGRARDATRCRAAAVLRVSHHLEASRLRHPRSRATPQSTGSRGSYIVPAALPETVFSIGTVAVLPLYGAMIGAPKAEWTQRFMRSAAPFAFMGALYFVAMLATAQSPAVRALLSTFVSGVTTSGDFIGNWLTFVSGCFGTAETAAAAWMHLLSLDLFVARHVFLDALAADVPAQHSLVLCCMFGPCGFLAHALTKAACARWRR